MEIEGAATVKWKAPPLVSCLAGVDQDQEQAHLKLVSCDNFIFSLIDSSSVSATLVPYLCLFAVILRVSIGCRHPRIP